MVSTVKAGFESKIVLKYQQNKQLSQVSVQNRLDLEHLASDRKEGCLGDSLLQSTGWRQL